MPVEVMKGFEEAFGCKILEGYGLSETSPVASFNHPDKERKPGSIGTPIEGVEMKLVDDDGNDVEGTDEVGEIAIKGHNVMKGYWNREDATKEVLDDDGWFHTGDMGKRDEDGYYFIVDRKKEMIIRGGYNVYPREIEEVLYEHPAVAEAAVVGVPDDKMGEEVGAAVVLKEGKEVDADELARLRQGAGRQLQVPAQDLVPRRAAEGPDGQDPQARGRGPRGGQDRLAAASPIFPARGVVRGGRQRLWAWKVEGRTNVDRRMTDQPGSTFPGYTTLNVDPRPPAVPRSTFVHPNVTRGHNARG